MMPRWMLVPALAIALAGCASTGDSQREDVGQQLIDPVTVRVSGYGTYENVDQDRTDTGKRLKARRASRLDAYRNLAERVYGTVIFGRSTVNDFVLQDDSFRAYVDSYVRGARVVAVNEHSDGVIETVMQLKLESAFIACAAQYADEAVHDKCSVPIPRANERVNEQSSGDKAESLYYLD
ncbi:LPP20 family lipoprotein [Marinobacter oulmenensis]|uniref:Lipoprotein LPP20-like domain-containing protein n=1 Tax=Marinobacter oulmenensis TaxID=643747 RepID=A0A840U720_9GAMM|nr:LPP20 family lipoprotein [Marinobacter oulmenensis]MBB5319993.1 hypothetical protein [Marinobacter oulmenensis]